MTKPLRFKNKSLRLKYKCLICIWIIFWAILDLFINPKYLFQNKSFSQTYYFKSEKSFVILTSLLGLKINPGNLESRLLNLILLNLIVRLPTERSHYTYNLWNATFGLWKIRIMNGWMVSFEWKTSKHHKNKELVASLWFYYRSFRW